jgi:hypothetical protein
VRGMFRLPYAVQQYADELGQGHRLFFGRELCRAEISTCEENCCPDAIRDAIGEAHVHTVSPTSFILPHRLRDLCADHGEGTNIWMYERTIICYRWARNGPSPPPVGTREFRSSELMSKHVQWKCTGRRNKLYSLVLACPTVLDEHPQ